MRRSMLAALVAAILPAWPAYAQASPPPPAAVPPLVVGPERAIMDAVFWSPPGPASDTCLELPAGQLTVTLKLAGSGPPQPVSFRFGAHPYQNADPTAAIAADVAPEPTTTAVPLAGGRYCYAIVNRAGPAGLAQPVALRMTLVPR